MEKILILLGLKKREYVGFCPPKNPMTRRQLRRFLKRVKYGYQGDCERMTFLSTNQYNKVVSVINSLHYSADMKSKSEYIKYLEKRLIH